MGVFFILSLALTAWGAQGSFAGDGPKDPGEKPAEELATQTEANEIKVATYNLLNLFDAEHDEGKLDYTFLPLGAPGKAEYCRTLRNRYYREQCETTDWNQQGVDMKLGQIKKVMEAQGSLPDILAVEEIENDNVAAMLAEKLGFDGFLITHSPDRRGIDVALLYRTRKLRVIDHEEIVLRGEDFVSKPTRNVLRVDFEVAGSSQILGVYANHWPSQAAGPEKRIAAATQVKESIIARRALKGANYSVIVLGDFNTLDGEFPNAIHHVLQNIAWDGYLLDSQQLSRRARSPYRHLMPPNSYWYRSHWQKLDRILLSRDLSEGGGLEVEPGSFRIFAAPFMAEFREITDSGSFLDGNREAAPKRFDTRQTDSGQQGYSDHLPVTVKIRIRTAK